MSETLPIMNSDMFALAIEETTARGYKDGYAQAMKEVSEIKPVGYVSKDTICNIKKRFNPKFNALQMISLRVKKYGKMTEPLIPRPTYKKE